jgi:hypothetical protein
MFGRPKKHHIIAATVTVAIGTVALVLALRGSGGAETARFTEVVDRCGDVVRTETGDPYMFRIEVEPPPLEGTVADPSAVVEQTTPDELDLVGVPIPADPRAVTHAQLSCGGS